MRIVDVFLAFPPIVFALLLVSAFGPHCGCRARGRVHTRARGRARHAGRAHQVVERDFVKAAEAVGEPRRRILFGELLPNLTRR